MRLATPVLVVAALLLGFPAGEAFAAWDECVHDRPCMGSGNDDHLRGTGGDDRILAHGGQDFVDARGGSDTVFVFGGTGDDGGEFAAGGLFGDSSRMSRPIAAATGTTGSTAATGATRSTVTAAPTCSWAAAVGTTSWPANFV